MHLTRFVKVTAGPVNLSGALSIPFQATGLVIFAHGSGSSRHSPRNQQVASHLNKERFATLLFDLLTEQEERERSNVFDIRMLGERLARATEFAQMELPGMSTGYFGASTGAAAALMAASQLGPKIDAVVSRGGRPDLAGDILPSVSSPTLLIVGSRDETVLQLNHDAASRMTCERRVAVVSGATHLFEEPGALDEVSVLAAEWFSTHLRTKAPA